jgi:hypothetical protein
VRGSENPAGGVIPDSWGGVHHHEAVTCTEARIIIDYPYLKCDVYLSKPMSFNIQHVLWHRLTVSPLALSTTVT